MAIALRKQFVFKLKSNEYTISIPNPGQLVDIESQKAILSSGLYADIMNSGTLGSNYSLDVIDIQAYLSVLCPELMKDMKVPTREMDLFDFRELRDAYVEQFVPWVNEWMTVLNPANTKQESKEVASDDKGGQ